MSEESEAPYFSFKGLLAAALSGFIAYQLFRFTEFIQMAERSYYQNNYFQFFIDLIRYSSEKGPVFVDIAYTKIKILIFVILVSYALKTILALWHAFVGYVDNKYIFYLFLVEAGFFGLFFGFTPFSEFLNTVLPIGIPSLIIYGFMDE
jgi:hypothetical protein